MAKIQVTGRIANSKNLEFKDLCEILARAGRTDNREDLARGAEVIISAQVLIREVGILRFLELLNGTGIDEFESVMLIVNDDQPVEIAVED